MVDFKEALPELDDPEFNRDLFMRKIKQPTDAVDFLIDVMSKRHYWRNEVKTITIQEAMFGIKKDDDFEKCLEYIFEYIAENNPKISERERLLYMFVLSDEIKCGIAEYEE